MTVEEFYQKLGGDYSDVNRRLPSIGLIKKYAAKFLEDKSFEELCLRLREGKREEAFRAAATLKEVCGNLGFVMLRQSLKKMTELLENPAEDIPEKAVALLEDVRRDYEEAVKVIRIFISQ